MDDTTRGVGRDAGAAGPGNEEFSGRADETTRSYAGEPSRSPVARPGTRPTEPTRSTTGDRPSDLDPDSDRRTREIQGEIAHTRAEMSETIDALQEKLRPGNLVSGATDKVKTATTERVRSMADTASGSAQGMAQGMIEGARQNPIPALMIGAGVAWMLIDRSRRGNGHTEHAEWSDYPSPGFGAHTDSEEYYRTSSVRSPGRSWTGQSSETVGSWARETGSQARYRARRAQNRMQRLMRDNPLLVGAAAMLVGAAIGASLPETDTENEWMGETRDTVLDRAQETAERAAGAVKEAANDVVGDTVSKVAEKVKER